MFLRSIRSRLCWRWTLCSMKTAGRKQRRLEAALSFSLCAFVIIFWVHSGPVVFTTVNVLPAKRQIYDAPRQFPTDPPTEGINIFNGTVHMKTRPRPLLENSSNVHEIPILSIFERVKANPVKNIDSSIVVVPTGPPVDYANKCPAMLTDIGTAPEGSMPLIALASFPRSGNTWTRMLLQIATKYSTGSVYWKYEKDHEWTKKVFPASTVDYHLRTGVCVKTHNYELDEIKEFTDGVILLIRDPYKSLMSEFFREKMFDKQFSFNKTIKLLKEFWWDYFPMRSYEWRTFNLAWIKNSRRLLVVFYEDLMSNTKYELTRMIHFLGQPVQLHRMQCAMMHYASKQLESTYIDFDPTTPEQHRVLDQYIAEVNRELVARGSKPMPKFRSN